ncbi:MAG: SGNH/GDSL hydrolase family protein [Rubrivivax sp.]|nr:MAG: SGNH/GDSL hydrolase family protein [Rubrivivax sp.]
MSNPVKLITPFELDHPEEPFPIDLYGQRFLAQGDSWFSIGAIPPWLTTNVLMELRTARRAVAVNCAVPGAVLRRMVDNVRARPFMNLLSGNIARKWDAVLISGGGNDLIEAIGSAPGSPRDKRLLLTAAERNGTGAASCLSDEGWQTFSTYLDAVFNGLMDLRDRGANQLTPLLLHTYAELRPRPAPAGPDLGPWLLPAMQAFEVPEAQWMAVGQLLMRRLGALLSTLAAERQAAHPAAGEIHVVDTQAAHLVPADAGSTGASGDWANEIHPLPDGYAKIASEWAPVIDALP